jgi:hypothetical protein
MDESKEIEVASPQKEDIRIRLAKMAIGAIVSYFATEFVNDAFNRYISDRQSHQNDD